MSQFTAGDVAKLREMTGVGMMDCKKAMVEANGNFDTAVEILRKKGQAGAANKALKEAREGLIVAHVVPGGKLGVLAEINCQTDFVARNDDFKAFADEIAKAYAANPNVDLEGRRTEMVAKIGENIRFARNARLQVSGAGQVAAYIHTGGKVGVLVEVGCGKDETTSKEEFKQLVKDITLQIAAANPIAVSRENVDAKVIEKEREIAAEQFKNKPAAAIAKIVEGKLNSYFQTVCLVDQGFVKDPEKTISAYIGEVGKKLGDEIKVRSFLRFQVGEAVAS
ncbi:MAG: Elongation factor Ts [Verrucomicrobiota bacterium]